MKNVPPEIYDEIQLWTDMMKYVLECAEISMKFIQSVELKADVSVEDWTRFENLCTLLNGVRQQVEVFLESSKNVPPCVCTSESFTQSPLAIKRCGTADSKHIPTKISVRNYCLCENVGKELISKSRKNEKIVVCSKSHASKFFNAKCEMEGCKPSRVMESMAIDGDDHSDIIKNQGGLTFRTTGVGYEFFHAMHRHPHRIAMYIVETGEARTYGEILRDSISAAITLKEKGLREDDVVCLFSSRLDYTVVPYFAGLFVGCQMTCINVFLPHEDIVGILKLVPPTTMFVSKDQITDIKRAIEEAAITTQIVSLGEWVEGHGNFEEYLKESDEEIKKFAPHKTESLLNPVSILYTSGTYGRPKAVQLSHSAMLNQYAQVVLSGMMGNICYTNEPISSATFDVILGSTVLQNTSIVFDSSPFEAERLYNSIQKFKIDSIFLCSHDFVTFSKAPTPTADISSLKRLATGGSCIKQSIIHNMRMRYPRASVFQVYGQTEAGGLILQWRICSHDDTVLMDAKPTSVGRPFAGFWYKIVAVGTSKILGPYETGELCIKGEDKVMIGYFHSSDSSAVFDKLGWLKTGDLVYYDDYHCFHIVHRMDSLIKYKDWYVPPGILEDILVKHPVVDRAVVIGVPNDMDCQLPTGCIVLKPDIDPLTVNLDEVAEFVNSKVDRQNELRGGVRIIPSIPMTYSGKISISKIGDQLKANNQDALSTSSKQTGNTAV